MQNAKRKVQNECVAPRLIKIIAEGNTDLLRLGLYTLHLSNPIEAFSVFGGGGGGLRKGNAADLG